MIKLEFYNSGSLGSQYHQLAYKQYSTMNFENEIYATEALLWNI